MLGRRCPTCSALKLGQMLESKRNDIQTQLLKAMDEIFCKDAIAKQHDA
jgi:hypothetical protein